MHQPCKLVETMKAISEWHKDPARAVWSSHSTRCSIFRFTGSVHGRVFGWKRRNREKHFSFSRNCLVFFCSGDRKRSKRAQNLDVNLESEKQHTVLVAELEYLTLPILVLLLYCALLCWTTNHFSATFSALFVFRCLETSKLSQNTFLTRVELTRTQGHAAPTSNLPSEELDNIRFHGFQFLDTLSNKFTRDTILVRKSVNLLLRTRKLVFLLEKTRKTR